MRLALIAGGDSPERAVSLRTAEQVAAALDPQRYQIHRYDPPDELERLVHDAPSLDFAFIALHGGRGEDGSLQGLLELLRLPYQGSGVLASALAMDKWQARLRFEAAGLRVPRARLWRRRSSAQPSALAEALGWPLVVKPRAGGSSLATSLLTEPEQLPDALERACGAADTCLVEEYVQGTELTAAVLGEETLPLVEIAALRSRFFDYQAKYSPGEAAEICPARLPDCLAERAREAGLRAHRSLGCCGYSRSDFILRDGTLFILETNTLPGLTAESLLPLAARAHGLSFAALLERLIADGLQRWG